MPCETQHRAGIWRDCLGTVKTNHFWTLQTFDGMPRKLLIGDVVFLPRYDSEELTWEKAERGRHPTFVREAKAVGMTQGKLFGACDETVGVSITVKDLRAKFRGLPRLNNYKDQAGVYYLSDGEYCKVGSSDDLRLRVNSHIANYPRPLRILKVWPGSRVLEEFLKALLRPFHVNGEWFCVPDEVSDAVCQIKSAADFPGIAVAAKVVGVPCRYGESEAPPSTDSRQSGD